MTKRIAPIAALALSTASLSAQLPATVPSPTPTATVAPTPPPEKAFQIGAQVRIRAEGYSNLDLSSSKPDRVSQYLSRVRLQGRFKRGPVSALVELQDSRVFGSEASTLANDRNTDLHQGYLSFGKETLFVRLGRQELSYAEQRLIGSVDYDNVGRSFDGGLLRARLGTSVTADLFASRVKQTSSATNDDANFYGLYASAGPPKPLGLELYALESQAFSVNALRQSRRTHTFGGRLLLATGGLAFEAEAAFQRGDELGQARRAFMTAGSARYLLGRRLKTTLGVEWSRGTGDGDPADGTWREFDNLFPTNHLKYGFLDLLGLRNNRMGAATLQLGRDEPHWWIRAVGRILEVDDARGRWTSAGGAVLGQDPTGASGRRIGTEVDLIGSATVLPGLVAHLQAGWLRPGPFARAVRGRDDAFGGALFLVFTY